MTHTVRLGASWTSKDPDVSPLTTIARIGTGEPDPDGRRDDDVLMGALPRGSAAMLVEIVNGAPDPAACATYIADRLESDLAAAGARAVRLAREYVERQT